MASKPNKPTPRHLHQTAVVGSKVFLWGGEQDGMPREHDTKEKREFLSKVDTFDLEAGCWQCFPTTNDPPLGCIGYACVAVDKSIYYFGGECGHEDCYHSTLHSLYVPSLEWAMLASYLINGLESENAGPMQKGYSGMVAFKASDGSDVLLVIGGRGHIPPLEQPGAKYKDICVDDDWLTLTNEQHIFSLVQDEWRSPNVIGKPPPPALHFTLTSISDNKAAMFGGRNDSRSFNDLMIVELTSDKQLQWTKMTDPISHHVLWPQRRSGHAASFFPSHNALIIIGGAERGTLCDDSWVYEFKKQMWRKVTLTEKITKRQFHSLSAFSPTIPHHNLLMAFGGLTITNSSWFWKSTDVPVQVPTVIFELVFSGGQWERTIVLEGSALARSQIFIENDRQVHQMLEPQRQEDRDLESGAEIASASKSNQQLDTERVQEQLKEVKITLEKLKEEKDKIIIKVEEEKKKLQVDVNEIQLQLKQIKINLAEVNQEKNLFQKQVKEAELLALKKSDKAIKQDASQQTEPLVKVDVEVQFPSECMTATPTNANLMTHVAKKIPARWFEVGIQLHIETAELNRFEALTKDQVRLCIMVFDEWKREQKMPYRWDTIISVLDRVGERETATDIRKWLNATN